MGVRKNTIDGRGSYANREAFPGAVSRSTQAMPEPLKVCMYTPFGDGGHARYTHELLMALSQVGREENVRMSLVTTRDLVPQYRTSAYAIYDILPPLKHREEFRGTLHWAGSRAAYYFTRERGFLHWARSSEACQAIHFQDYTTWLAPRHFRLLKSWGKRLFFTIHNINVHSYYPGVPKAVVDSWGRASMRQCDGLLVHTEDLRERLSGFLGKGHPPIHVTPHGVWSTFSDEGRMPSVEQRIRSKRLLFFGVIRPNKGLHVLLRAMERLPGHSLVVAGASEDHKYENEIRRQLIRLPAGKVRYIDRFVEDGEIPELFSQSSMVVLPYTAFTAQSGVLHDALAYGLPVVVTDVGALGDSVRRWGIGRVVPPDDDKALADAILELLEPQRYREASQAADSMRESLSWTHTAETTIEAYRSV